MLRNLGMRKISILIFVGLLLGGCKSMTLEERFAWEEKEYNKKLESTYAIGAKQSEIRLWKTRGMPQASVARPLKGWDYNDISDDQIHRAAYLYEKNHGAEVSSCDAYYIPRSIFGLYLDYLFFNENGKLIGYHRRLID